MVGGKFKLSSCLKYPNMDVLLFLSFFFFLQVKYLFAPVSIQETENDYSLRVSTFFRLFLQSLLYLRPSFLTYSQSYQYSVTLLSMLLPSFFLQIKELIKVLLQNLNRIQRVLLLLLSHFSHVQLCVIPQTAAHQAPPSLRFSRQEHWSGLPFPSPMRESEN